MRNPMSNLAAWRRLAMPILFTAGLLWATNKGPDAFGYTASDNTTYTFIDPAGSGGAPSVLAGTDDGGALLTLPFTFQFYGNSYTAICVSANGIAYLGASQAFCSSLSSTPVDFANTDISSTVVPGDQPAIAPLWMDLTFAPQGGGAVYYQTVGTMPNRQFVIEWYNAFPANALSPVTFEAILNEGSNNVLFQYQTVNLGNSSPASLGGLATIGIRNSAGNTNSQNLQWSFDSAVLSNSSAVLYTAPSTTATSVNTINTSPSGLTVTVDNVAMSTPAVVSWVPGTTHTLSVSAAAQNNGGVQTTFSSWSPSGSTSQISVQALATGIAYTANFTTQYQLTATANPSNEGSVSGSGFYSPNATVTVTATPTAPYVFKNFSGDLGGTTASQTVTMSAPKTIVANFGVAYACSVSGGNSATIADVQSLINQALGKTPPANDVNSDGATNLIDVQIVVEALMGAGCIV
jgi:hypothetical protein